MVKKTKIFLLTSLFVAGCNGPLDELEKSFSSNESISSEPIESKTIVFTSKHHKGAYSYRELTTTRVNSNLLDIEVDFPFFGFFDSKIHIPISEISGCRKSCFSKNDWDADILLGDVGIEISFDNSKNILEWCFQNELPMLTGKSKRNWMYEDGQLPSRENYVHVSREVYEKQTESSCLGY